MMLHAYKRTILFAVRIHMYVQLERKRDREKEKSTIKLNSDPILLSLERIP